MNYSLVYSKDALQDLEKLDRSISERIMKKVGFWIRQANPLVFAKSLTGELTGYYRFRIGDYRVIFRQKPDGKIIILFILAVRHRREIYRI